MPIARIAAASILFAWVAAGQTTYGPGRIFLVQVNGQTQPVSGDIAIPVSLETEGHRLTGSLSVKLPSSLPGGTLTSVASGRNILNLSDRATSEISADVTWNYPASPGGSFSASGSISQRPTEVSACTSLLSPVSIQNPAASGSRPLSLTRTCNYTSLGTGAETPDGVYAVIQTTIQITGGRATISASVSVTYEWKPAAPTDNVSLDSPSPTPGAPVTGDQPASFSARVRAQAGTVELADLILVLLDGAGNRVAQSSGITIARGPATTSTLTIDTPPLGPGTYSLAAVLTESGTANIIAESARIAYTVQRFRLTLGTRGPDGEFQDALPGLRANVFETAGGTPLAARLESTLGGAQPVEITGEMIHLSGQRTVVTFAEYPSLDQANGSPAALARLETNGIESIEFQAVTRVTAPGGTPVSVRSNRIVVKLDAIRAIRLTPASGSRVARGTESRFEAELEINSLIPSRLVVRIADRTAPGGFRTTELDTPVTGKQRKTYAFTTAPPAAPEESAISAVFALEQTGGSPADAPRAATYPDIFPFQDPLVPSASGLQGGGVLLENLSGPPPAQAPSVSRSHQLPVALTLLAPGVFTPFEVKDPAGALPETDLSRLLPLGATWEFEPALPAGQLAGRITFSYRGLELPAEPGFSESAIVILSVSEAGEVTRWETTVDTENKTASAAIRGLPRYWVLAAFGPFSTRALAAPAPGRSTLLNFGSTATAEGVPPLVLTPVDRQTSVLRSSSRTISGSTALTGESAGLESLALDEPVAGALAAPAVRPATFVHAVNPESVAQEILFVLFAADGAELGRRREWLSPLARGVWSVSTLFENLPADFTGSLFVSPSRRLSAAIVESGSREIAASLLIRPPQSPATWHSSLAAAGSTVSLVNFNRSEAARVTLRWRAPGGSERGSTVRTIDPGAMLRETIGSLFGGSEATGSLTVDLPALVAGWIEAAGEGRTIVPLESPRRYAVAPALAAAPGESAISIFNPGTSPALVEIASRQDTSTPETRRFTIPAGGLLAETIRAANQAAINASSPVVSQILLRASGDIAFAAVQPPPPGVTVPRALDPPAVTAPRIAVAPAALDFGTVTNGQSRTLNLTISNTGSAQLTISAAAFSNAAFTTPAALPLILPVGGSSAMAVRFAPTAAGAVAARLDLTSNDPANARLTVNLTGAGSAAPASAPKIEASRSSVDFGNVSPGSQTTQPLQIRNTGTAVLEISTLTLSDSRFSLPGVTTPISIQPQSSVSWTVRLSPGPNTGNLAATLTIASNDAANPSLQVALTATVAGPPIAPKITPSQTTIDFGGVNIGQTAEQTIEIRNTGNAELEVESIRTTSDRFRVPGATSFRLPPGVVFDLRVTYTPTIAGEERAILRILSNDPGSPTELILTGSGR